MTGRYASCIFLKEGVAGSGDLVCPGEVLLRLWRPLVGLEFNLAARGHRLEVRVSQIHTTVKECFAHHHSKPKGGL